VDSAMQGIQRVIAGTALLTADLLSLGNSLLLGTIPPKWEDQWEGPEDPYEYLRGLVSRAVALCKWVERCTHNSLFNQPLDISELFRPQTFINALRQQTARTIKKPVNTLKLVSALDPKLMENYQVKVAITGLLLQGCGFDGGRLSEAHPDTPTMLPLPPFLIAWIPGDAQEPYPEQNCISTPVYYTSKRERLITELKLPCSGEKSRWILAGVAAFLNE
jgi:dynein heavy chain 2